MSLSLGIHVPKKSGFAARSFAEKITFSNTHTPQPQPPDLKPGLNFINVLHTAFTLADPECAKKDSQVCIGEIDT
jgi:hypothetical protein